MIETGVLALICGSAFSLIGWIAWKVNRDLHSDSEDLFARGYYWAGLWSMRLGLLAVAVGAVLVIAGPLVEE